MGVGYNDSIAASNTARRKASTRTPIHFYFNVPIYQYDLECGTRERIHIFYSRTPLVPAEEHDDFSIVWCDLCQTYRSIPLDQEPLNLDPSADELTSFEQDKGILRERIALLIQDLGFLDNEAEVMDAAIQFGVPVREIKRINAGLRAPVGLSGEPDLCKAGMHEMTLENIAISRGRRQCKACRAIAQRNRRQKARAA